MKPVFAVILGMATLGGSTVVASSPDDGDAIDSFAAWLASTEGSDEDYSHLSHLACEVGDNGEAFCYGLSFRGYSGAFWSPNPHEGDWIPATERPIANEDRPPPSDDVTAVEYTSAWDGNPDLDSVTFITRDDLAPSTQSENYFIEWDPEPVDSGDGWARIQGFAEAVGCDIPVAPPVLATDIDCVPPRDE